MAIRIRLKGPFDLKALIPDDWTFCDLIAYLPELLSIEDFPIIYRNHMIFDMHTEEKISTHLQKNFDCHFVEKKIIYTLKIEKILFTPEELLLPLNLYEIL